MKPSIDLCRNVRLCCRYASISVFFALTFSPASAQTDSESSDTKKIDSSLARLHHDDMDVRIEALRELMSSLDPRIPSSMIPLLADKGNSIRRLAARAVGSRWWQISSDGKDAFINALKRNAKAENYDEANMAKRALGLLRRDYDGEMFSRSPNQRWVIYERRGLPCLIDTQTETEELLGWSAEDSAWISASWGNDTLNNSVTWHPNKKNEVVALSMLLHRKASSVWLWQHGEGLLALTVGDFARALGTNEDEIFHPGGFFAEVDAWKGDDLLIDLYLNTEKGEKIIAWDAELAWNLESRSLRNISMKKSE
jgi:hypothetical protein